MCAITSESFVCFVLAVLYKQFLASELPMTFSGLPRDICPNLDLEPMDLPLARKGTRLLFRGCLLQQVPWPPQNGAQSRVMTVQWAAQMTELYFTWSGNYVRATQYKTCLWLLSHCAPHTKTDRQSGLELQPSSMSFCTSTTPPWRGSQLHSFF